jgi:hypothetical protein
MNGRWCRRRRRELEQLVLSVLHLEILAWLQDVSNHFGKHKPRETEKEWQMVTTAANFLER